MRFNVGSYTFDITGHERIAADGVVREQFAVALYQSGQPQPWHPGDSDSNVEVHEWVGRLSVPTADGGTKRGADYRSRFWPSLLYWADKAVAASKSGKRISEVADSEMTRTRMNREPVDLKALSLDEAAAELTRAV